MDQSISRGVEGYIVCPNILMIIGEIEVCQIETIRTFRGLRFTAEGPLTDGNIPV